MLSPLCCWVRPYRGCCHCNTSKVVNPVGDLSTSIWNWRMWLLEFILKISLVITQHYITYLVHIQFPLPLPTHRILWVPPPVFVSYKTNLCSPGVLEHGQLTRGHVLGKTLSLSPQQLTIANSSTARVGIMCLIFISILWFCLAWACTGSVCALATSMQLSCCVQRTLFLWHHSLLLPLTIFLPPLSQWPLDLGRRECTIYVPYRDELLSLLFSETWTVVAHYVSNHLLYIEASQTRAERCIGLVGIMISPWESVYYYNKIRLSPEVYDLSNHRVLAW